MPALTNTDVQWYVATRKDSGAHFVLNENYIEAYENEFERIREFDTVEEATEAQRSEKQLTLRTLRRLSAS